MILETPTLKDGSGREFYQFHDTVQLHLCALRALDHEPSSSFIISMLELKLDMNTMYEWQRHSQAFVDVSLYQELFHFIDLRAQASESLIESAKKPHKIKSCSLTHQKHTNTNKPVASFMVNTDAAAGNCVVYKTEKYPPNACTKFRAFIHDKMLSTLKFNRFCLNCL